MNESWKHPGRLGGVVYAVGALFFGLVVTVFSRLRIAKHQGRRRAVRALPAGPIIIVSNHASYADGVLLALVCRRMGRSIRLLATAEVFRAPLLGWLARRLGFIAVNRGSADAADALTDATEALSKGEAIGIFPEGRTTRDPNQWPERAKTGAVRLALRTGAPIVPVVMVGTHRVLGRRAGLRSVMANLILRPKVMTEVGDPIDAGALLVGSAEDPDAIRNLTDLIWSEIVRLVETLRGEAAPDPHGVSASTDDDERGA